MHDVLLVHDAVQPGQRQLHLVHRRVERDAVVGDARSALLYVANWNFIREGQDYFAESLESSPFLHLWSLSVEEQFYVLWPLVVLVIWAVASRPQRALLVLAVSGAVVSLAAMFAIYDGGDYTAPFTDGPVVAYLAAPDGTRYEAATWPAGRAASSLRCSLGGTAPRSHVTRSRRCCGRPIHPGRGRPHCLLSSATYARAWWAN